MKKEQGLILIANGCRPLFAPRQINKAGKYYLSVLKDTDFTFLVQTSETDSNTGKLKYKAISENDLQSTKNAKILCFCDMSNVKTSEKMNVSIDFEKFSTLKVGQILAVTVNDKGYNSIDYKALSTTQVNKLTAEEVEA